MPTNFYCMVVQGKAHNSLCVSRVYPYTRYQSSGTYRSVRAVYGVTLGILLLTVYFDGMPSSGCQWFFFHLALFRSYCIALIIHILCREWYVFGQLQLKRPVKLSAFLRVMGFSIFRVVVAVYVLLSVSMT